MPRSISYGPYRPGGKGGHVCDTVERWSATKRSMRFTTGDRVLVRDGMNVRFGHVVHLDKVPKPRAVPTSRGLPVKFDSGDLEMVPIGVACFYSN